LLKPYKRHPKQENRIGYIYIQIDKIYNFKEVFIMTTQAHPIKEIAKNTYEIDEFDCGSIFLLVGEEKALVIDTGSGIGDLRGVISSITKLPLVLVLTHGHGDHTGGLGWFDEYYMNTEDWDKYTWMEGLEGRKHYAKIIADREGKKYDYDPELDILPWPKAAKPKRLPLEDGEKFDLGGRIVTSYHCPGHTPGSMVFLDPKSRILFSGDSSNCNMLLSSTPSDPTFTSIEKALKALKRIYAMRDQYDRNFNQHHDYRPLGEPLDESVLPNIIRCCEDLVSGDYICERIPGLFPGMPERTIVRHGSVFVTYEEAGIKEP